MSRLLGSYGTVRPADFDVNDAEIFYDYSPDRNTKSQGFIKIDASSFLFPTKESAEGIDLYGMYQLRLGSEIFSKKGIYNIYIRPKQIKAQILDCAFLNGTAIKGIIIDRNAEGISGLNTLDGYRVEYFENGSKIKNFFRIVTSTLIVEPVPSSNTGTPSDRLISYAVNDSSSQFFLTLSPSVNIVDGFNTSPFIGVPSQQITLTNTFFDPISLEIELTDNTLDTIAAGIYGNHLKNVQTGQYGIFDANGNILKAYALAEVKDDFGSKQYEIRTEIPADTAELPFKDVDRIVRRGIL